MPNLPKNQDFDLKQLRISEHTSLSDLMLSSHLMFFASNDSDYFVSALDISKLDLSNVDLCVLATSNSLYSYSTSCQDFGILKALKFAGVKSILGSLWNVVDVATQILMTQFYTNLTGGKSKRQSLLDAQRYLREYEVEDTVTVNANLTPTQKKRLKKQGKSAEQRTETRPRHPYAAPEYWAAFILLDATD